MTMFVGVAAAVVVNAHVGPGVDPPPFRAMICQKYVVPAVSPDTEYDADVCPVDTCGGGLFVPNFTS